MMKYAFLILSLSFLFGLFSQTDSQQYENAYYQVKHNNESAYTTIVKSTDYAFTQSEILELQSNMLKKEGVFKIEAIENGMILRVYHLSYIEIETLKLFILRTKESVLFEERKFFSF